METVLGFTVENKNAPLEFEKEDNVLAGVETFTEGEVTRHRIAVRSFSPAIVLSVACAQIKRLAPATITAMIFFVPKRAVVEKAFWKTLRYQKEFRTSWRNWRFITPMIVYMCCYAH